LDILFIAAHFWVQREISSKKLSDYIVNALCLDQRANGSVIDLFKTQRKSPSITPASRQTSVISPLVGHGDWTHRCVSLSDRKKKKTR